MIAADNDQTAVQLKLYELAPYQYEQDISDLIPVSVQSAPMNGNVFCFPYLDMMDKETEYIQSLWLFNNS